MDGVEPGEVKWLRINEALPRYWSTGRRWSPSLSSSSGRRPCGRGCSGESCRWKRTARPTLSCRPIAASSSRLWTRTSEKSNANERMSTTLRERSAPAPAVTGRDIAQRYRPTQLCRVALTRPPSQPQPQPCDLVENGGDGHAGQVIHYPTDIQPIFDANCVELSRCTRAGG